MRTPPGEVLRRPGLAGLALLALLAGSPAAEAARTPRRAGGDYLVLFKKDVSLKAAHRAVRRSGGRIVRENRTVGLALVHARRAAFRGAADRTAAVAGVARNRTIGRARDRRKAGVERTRDARAGAPAPAAHRPARGEPFGPLQWDMQLMGATPQGSYARDQSSHAVRVGIIDTGIDGRHPDIKPNFDRRLSRNFTRDDPVIDGPCARDIDGSCQADPPDVDEDGHGTHVAGTIGAAINGLGMAGVAPKADLVDLRAGQDSGYFFILPTVDALTFAGRHGIDVVNMSFYIDPWLFDCTSNRGDSRAEQREQQIIRRAATRALDFAHRHGVTMIAAEGNESTDLGHPRSDATSPDYPDQIASPHRRRIDDRCLSEPSEGPHVINVSSIGRSLRKAVYSNYGVEQTDVAAPGGDSHDFFGTRRHRVPRATEILAPYPRNVARADGDIDARGRIRAGSRPYVLKDTEGGKTAYYQYLEGTSMASPHAVGVAALIIARHGVRDHRHAGLEMRPEQVRRRLEATATPRACPAPEPFTYPGEPASANATCAGTLAFNGFYGHGIVNALRASVR